MDLNEFILDTPIDPIAKDVQWAIDYVVKYMRYCNTYYSYYEGNQPLNFSNKRFRTLFGTLFNDFSCNICRIVIDIPTDKLSVSTFTIPSAQSSAGSKPKGPTTDIISLVDQIWEDNFMDRVELEVYSDSAVSGNGYVIVWPDEDGQPSIESQDPWTIAIKYDPEDRSKINIAAKVWLTDEKFIRINLYYIDRIVKLISKGEEKDGVNDSTKAAAFEPYYVDDEDWPLSNPYEVVPVFHFPNGGKIGSLGRSDLEDVIPIQDAVNKTLMDMLVSGEFQSYPQRWAVGVEEEEDPETNLPINPFRSGAERIWTVSDSNAKFGQFEAADLGQFLEIKDGLVIDVARVARIPLHYFVGFRNSDRPPSGDSLRTAEEPLISKVKKKQKSYAAVWTEVIKLCLKIIDETPIKVRVLWQDVEPKNYLTFYEGLTILKQLGLSGREILRKLGYSDTEIETIHSENIKDLAYDQKINPQSQNKPKNYPPGSGSTNLPTKPDIGDKATKEGGNNASSNAN
jgi:hypothetical protein